MSASDPFAALRIADFRFFLAARILVNMAIKMQGVIVGWQIYSITKDPLALGMIGLAEALPALSVALYAGYLADKMSRRRLAGISYAILFVSTLMLLFLSSSFSEVFMPYRVRCIYGVIFLTGLARGFLSPAMFGLMSQCVPSSLYANSSAWNSSLGQISMVTGAAISGLLFAFTDYFTTYLVTSLLLLAGMLAVSFITSKPKPILIEGRNMLDNLLSGIRFVFSNQIFLGALSLDLFAVLFGGAVALLPVFADEILQAGPSGLGLLRAAPSAGAFIMAMILIFKPPLGNIGRYFLASVAGFGICMILFGLSSNFYLSLALLFISGVLDNVSVVVRSVIMQTLTPDNMKGRVSAVNSMFIGSSNEIGAFESGLSARFFGTVPSVVLGGFLTLAVVIITGAKAPLLRKLTLKGVEDEKSLS